MKFRPWSAMLGLLLWASFLPLAYAQGVHVWRGSIDIPTYVLGDEDRNPAFPLVAPRRVYPYTMLDDLTRRREMKTYNAIFLENEFLKAIILPDLAGRILSLYDKSAHREVFHHNHVVKPSLIGVRGAWISGGLEFNFPDAHTAVAVSPVSSTILQNPDGSATVSVGDLDWASEMAWQEDLTLRPGQARLELNVTLFNDTPLTNRYWYWDIAAVYTTEDMQLIYPMREAYTHNRGEVISYPIENGIDWSWYKNGREWMSLFGRQVQRNFFGAYYHNSDYGVVHTADYRDLPGKKMWTWGRGEEGKVWGEEALTDNDGPYNEIQAGRYETQLNYEFMPPRRVESFVEYWYPVRGLGGGFVEATNDLALNVRFWPPSGGENAQVELAVYPTAAIRGAKVRVKLGSQLIRHFGPIAFKASTPQKFMVPVEDLQTAQHELVVNIQSAEGKTLLHWSAADPIDGNPDFVPMEGTSPPPPKPSAKMSVEELFQFGVKKEKEYGVELAKPGQEEEVARIYQQVLERDPGFTPALLKLAWRRYRAADFRGAEELLARVRDRFDPTLNYAYGVIYRDSGRLDRAANAFWTSAHYGGPSALPYAQLGETLIQQKKYFQAVKWLRQALDHNPGDVLALTDLAVALRLAGNTDEASQVADQAIQKMRLLPFAEAEHWRVAKVRGRADQPAAATHEPSRLLDSPYLFDYLEVAAWYRSLGDLPSSDAVLYSALKDFPAQEISPLVYYHLASNARQGGKAKEADQFAAQASAAVYEKVFPSRVMDAVVLQDAIEHNPNDAHARYFLGNLYFANGRYEGAAKLWREARSEGFECSVLERNLGVYAWLVKKDLPEAGRFYEKAIQLAPDDYRLYADADEIYFALGDTSRRAKILEAAPASVLDRDIVRVRLARLRLQQKRYQEALELMLSHHFNPRDNDEINRQVYVSANIEKGRAELRAGEPSQAEKSFRRAAEYPPTLGIGKPDEPSDAEAYYWLGEALKAEGKTEAAQPAWREATKQRHQIQGLPRYSPKGVPELYSALALRQLGQTEEGEKILSELAEAAAKEDATAGDFYVAGLVQRFRGREDAAQINFRRAVEVDPSVWQARLALAQSGS